MNHQMILMAKKIFLAFWLFLGLGIQCQDGSLDTTFNSTGPQPGVVTTPIGVNAAASFTIAVQADGKIVVAGTDSFNFASSKVFNRWVIWIQLLTVGL